MSKPHNPDAVELKRSRLPIDVCEHLCTKTLYMVSEDPNHLEDDPNDPRAETASYWCNWNQMPYGDDGEQVSPELCRPGRACCESRLPPSA